MAHRIMLLVVLWFVCSFMSIAAPATASTDPTTYTAASPALKTAPTIRFATFNASLNRATAGQLITDLSTPDNQQARTVAEIIQRSHPDVLLINEFDFDERGKAARLFLKNYLNRGQNSASPVDYKYVFVAPSNTGIASGFDLNNNGVVVTTPGAAGYGDDALGFGAFPGQFGMVVYSKYPFETDMIRTFQTFLWKDMPGALLPDDPATPAPNDWYSPAELAIFRLPSKSHWDIPIKVRGELIHALVSHPTPPVFDGPEDRNGKRNHDEIRLWADYITPEAGGYIYDDQGKRGGLKPGSSFVIMGDQNADPNDGDSVQQAVDQLLTNALINTSITPTSPGGPEQAQLQGGANASHISDPAYDTADFADTTPGNLRADYVLPSVDLRIRAAAVFWPLNSDPLFRLVGTFDPALPGGFPSSDHRLVWIDAQHVPSVKPTLETAPVIDDEEPTAGRRFGDADDPAIWVHPTDPAQSLVVAALKNGGLDVYDLDGKTLQSLNTDGSVRYNNMDIVYGFILGGRPVDLAVASDRRNDKLAIFAIDPTSRRLSDVTAPDIGLIFTPTGQPSNRTSTAYGLAAYHSPRSGEDFVFVSKRTTGMVAQLRLIDKGSSVSATIVRTFDLIAPNGESLQVEGMVADKELGYLYAGQEDVGVWKIGAEPNDQAPARLIEQAYPAGLNLVPDVEGLTIYYAKNGEGYLLVSSQGDSTFAVFARSGDNHYLGSFRVGDADGIDSDQNSDGSDVVNVPLGRRFPNGLLVVHDGSNDPPVLDADGENISTNFKFVDWEAVAQAFESKLKIDTKSYDPRKPRGGTLPNGVAVGDVTATSAVLWARSTALGKLIFEYSTDPEFSKLGAKKHVNVTDPLLPVKFNPRSLKPGTTYYYRVIDAAGTTAEGSFRTPAEAGEHHGLRFGVTGDWRGELSPYPAISNAADRDLDFFVEHGDTIYADYPSPALNQPQATTLEDYRIKNAEVYGSRAGANFWAKLRASTAVLATIDDHEVTDDFAGGAPCSSDQRFVCSDPAQLINDSPLYETGLQAFQEYNPLRDEFYGSTNDLRTSQERRLYRYRTHGDDAAVFLLDTRSFRDPELPNVTNPNDPAQVQAFLVASFDPTRTLLGQQQFADLQRDLLKAQQQGITWKFVMVPEPIQNLGILAAADRYEGYAAERTKLLRFIKENGISNVVFITADIHGTLVNNLTYQEGPGQPQIAVPAFEISTGSVAFDAPFGPTVANLAAALGLLSPAQLAAYNALPRSGKDAFIATLVNAQLVALGYDRLGLDGSELQATLLQGSYVPTHVFGWTEFAIDRQTQQLRVTTYGIDSYTPSQVAADPDAILSRTPTVVSEFVVDPVGR